MQTTITRVIATTLALAAGSSIAATAPATPAAPKFDSATISGLGSRNIGPSTMSGRVSALTGTVKDGKVTLYVGAAGGGVWKSENGGTTFKPVFDRQPVQSIGAIAVDPGNAKTIWVGTGESWTRNSVGVGNGIYKSVDGGETWSFQGLPNSERVSRILVDPKDGNIVYACVPGKLWSDSPDRGLYKTTDGGANWALVLKGGNLSTGCASISMDPADPAHLFASLWDFRRKGWTFRSGGEGPTAKSGSGMFSSRDGGRTWSEVTPEANAGFPAKPYGRIAVEIAPSNSQVVYAAVESVDSALYRSADGGKTWEKRDKSQNMVWRPFYFSHLTVDPKNADKLFKMNFNSIVSTDGGKTFANSGGGMHPDWHDVWINPENPNMVVGGTDGGIGISYDGGTRWNMAMNLPISQFYHASVDDKDPYQVYGGMQDNGSWVGDSSYPGGVGLNRWEGMFFGDGFWTFSDPADPDYVYAEAQGGIIGRINRHTHEIRLIQPTYGIKEEGYKEKLRWNWNTPIHMSPNEKGTIYMGAQYLFRSRDHGVTWDRLSPDLTTNDKQKQRQEESGGITVDNSAAEMHTTIYSISESPRDAAVIWVGTDDGNVQVTRDGAKSWTNVVGNIKGLPKNSWVSTIEASRHDSATAYATFDRHTYGDMDPHAFVTRDYGKTWSRIASAEQGIRGYAHVIKDDAVNPNLLFLGTEFGLWISNDAGRQWAEFKGGNFPSVAVRDIALHNRDSDLVLATHGRGIWIIDDVTPLRALTPETLAKDATFVSARPTQQRLQAFASGLDGDGNFTGDPAPGAAQITYYQRTRHLFGKLKLEILDPQGKVIETLPASKHRGLNRMSWGMSVRAPRVPPAAGIAGNATQGPRVVPGTYTVRLTKGKDVYESKLEIGLDRRAGFSVSDRKAQFDAVMRVHAMFGRMSDVAARVSALRDQSLALAADANAGDLKPRLSALAESADGIRKEIVATKEGGAITGEERLREHMDNLYGALGFYEGRPALYLLERADVLEAKLNEVAGNLDALVGKELGATNDALKAKGLPPIVLPNAASGDSGGATPAKAGGRKQKFAENAQLKALERVRQMEFD